MDPLDAIINTFQTGKPKEALAELQTLVDKLKQDAPADLTSDHYDVLGQFKNFLGDADGAVEAYLEGVALVEQKRAADGRFPDEIVGAFINLNLKIAKLAHRQGKEGSGVIYKKNSVSYGPTKTKSDEEEEAWKKERFERGVKAYKAAIDSLGNDEEDAEYKEQFRTQLAACYFDMKDFKSAIQLYDDAFAVSLSQRCITLQYILLSAILIIFAWMWTLLVLVPQKSYWFSFVRRTTMQSGSIKPQNVFGAKTNTTLRLRSSNKLSASKTISPLRTS